MPVVMPTVTVEQHREMVRLGIKVRSDGKFGFKRKCARPACDTMIQRACYCADTFEDAVRGVEERSEYTCSTACFILQDRGYAEDRMHEDRHEDPDLDAATRDVLQHFGATPDEDSYALNLPPDWPSRLQNEAPPLWDRVVAAVREYVLNEDWDPDPEECECDVEG